MTTDITDWGPDFGANALGSPPVQVSTLAPPAVWSKVRQYAACNLGIRLLSKQTVEPVFAEVLQALAATSEIVPARLRPSRR